MKFAVAQLGARMHYAVPEILESAGALERLYTDLYLGPWTRRALGPLTALPGGGGLRALLGRHCAALPEGRVTSFPALGLAYSRRRARARTPEEQAAVFLWAGETLCRKLAAQGPGAATHTYSFNTAGLEWMRASRARGLKNVVEQTLAPKRVEVELLAREAALHPGWEHAPAGEPTGAVLALAEREEAEWAEADLILCGSGFVREGIAARGGPVERCAVVPYGVAPASGRPGPRLWEEPSRPLRVLTVGAVGLRKGSPYVLETARLCRGQAVFRMVGPIHAEASALHALSQEVEVLGPIPRSEIARQYAWADVFFLPSVCEGSATVTYEALAHGLPVLTTPNAGSVVTHGRDGWVVPLGDTAGMAMCLATLKHDVSCLRSASELAYTTSNSYNIAFYRDRLMNSIQTLA